MSINIAAVMVKHPQLGKVKTRLSEITGAEKALQVYTHLLENLEQNCLPKAVNSYLLGSFVTPENKVLEFQKMYETYNFYISQHGDNLGERMKHAFEHLFRKMHAEKGLLIGADIPHLNSSIIETAFSLLDSSDIVLGPTQDGGYYLIGMKSIHKELFKNISWGTKNVFETTIKICQKASLKYSLLDTLSDLDNAEDLELFPEIVKKMQ